MANNYTSQQKNDCSQGYCDVAYCSKNAPNVLPQHSNHTICVLPYGYKIYQSLFIVTFNFLTFLMLRPGPLRDACPCHVLPFNLCCMGPSDIDIFKVSIHPATAWIQ